METKTITVNHITSKHTHKPYNGNKIIYNEKGSPLQLIIGKRKKTFYALTSLHGKTIRKKLGSMPEMNVYDAQLAVHYFKSNIEEEANDPKVKLLEVIYGDPRLYKTKSNKEVELCLPKDSYLYKKAGKKSFPDIRRSLNYLIKCYEKKNGNLNITLDKITKEQLLKFAKDYALKKDKPSDQGRSSDQAHRIFNCWKTFLKWCSNSALIKYNPIADNELPIKKERKKREKEQFNQKELHLILAHFPNELKAPYGYLAPLMLLTGRRGATLVELRKKDINYEKRILLSREDIEKSQKFAKGKVDLEIALSSQAIDLLKNLDREFDSEWLFPKPEDLNEHIDVSARGGHRQHLDNAKKLFTKISPESTNKFTNDRCRLTFGTLCDELDIPTHIKNACIGHSGAKTMFDKSYTRKTYREDKIEAVEKISQIYNGGTYEDNVETKINKFLPDNPRKRILSVDYPVVIKEFRDFHSIKSQETPKTTLFDDTNKLFDLVCDFVFYEKVETFNQIEDLFNDDIEEFIQAYSHDLSKNTDLYNIFSDLSVDPNLRSNEHIDRAIYRAQNWLVNFYKLKEDYTNNKKKQLNNTQFSRKNLTKSRIAQDEEYLKGLRDRVREEERLRKLYPEFYQTKDGDAQLLYVNSDHQLMEAVPTDAFIETELNRLSAEFDDLSSLDAKHESYQRERGRYANDYKNEALDRMRKYQLLPLFGRQSLFGMNSKAEFKLYDFPEFYLVGRKINDITYFYMPKENDFRALKGFDHDKHFISFEDNFIGEVNTREDLKPKT